MSGRGRNERRVTGAAAGTDGAVARADDPTGDEFLAHVARVMGPSPGTAPRPAPVPSGQRTAGGTAEPCRLRCVQCGWAVECLPADRERFVRAGCMQCRSAVVAAAGPSASATTPSSRRNTKRRRPRGAGWVEVRAWVGDWGPDLALAVADVGEEGLGVWLSAPVRPGQAVRVGVVRSGGTAPAYVPAEVRWCAPAADWTYRAGLRLSRPLTPEELAVLAL